MKKSSFYLILINLIFMVYTSLAHAEKQTITELKVLPYIEAEGELDSSEGDELLTWVAPNKVLFGTYINSHFSDPSCGGANPRPECKKNTFDRTKILMVFDITTKKTTFNIKNEFYDSQLDLFSRHLYGHNYDCPYEKKEGVNTKARYIALKQKDGCIKEIPDDRNFVREFSFVRPDGKNFHMLERPFGDELRYWSWIDWLNVYLLRTHVSFSITIEANRKSYVSSPSSVIFLSPKSGDFKYVDIGEHEFSGATATRAGVIVYLDSNVNSKIEEERQGLTLIHGNQNYVIARDKRLNNTAVSSDGCHVAYLVPRRVNEMRKGYLQDIIYNKLRVIDVCEGFGVARDANPFASLLN